MRKNQQLVIVLPESSEELPIRIVRGSRSIELRLCLCPPDGEERHINETCPERKYVFIWRQNGYLKTAVDEIQWVEAAGSQKLSIFVTGQVPEAVLEFPDAGDECVKVRRSAVDETGGHVAVVFGHSVE